MTDVVHSLKEGQVERQPALRKAPMRTQPRAEQAPHAFNRVDVDFIGTVAIVITCPFPVSVIHGDVCVAPGGHPGVDRVFIGVDDTACLNGV